MSKRLDLVGKKFGKLTVESFSHAEKGYTYWKCQCECGNEIVIKGSYLTSKTKPTKSCGCLVKETVPNNLPENKNIKHNMSGTKFYNVWNSMIMRCTNPNSSSYSRYGARGIKVCKRWRIFKNFYEDMFGEYKEGLTLDRKDFNGDYSKENCRWVSPKLQANNTSSNHCVEYQGEKYTLSELSEAFKIPYHTLKKRIYKGWSIENAIKIPVQGRNKNDTLSRKQRII